MHGLRCRLRTEQPLKYQCQLEIIYGCWRHICWELGYQASGATVISSPTCSFTVACAFGGAPISFLFGYQRAHACTSCLGRAGDAASGGGAAGGGGGGALRGGPPDQRLPAGRTLPHDPPRHHRHHLPSAPVRPCIAHILPIFCPIFCPIIVPCIAQYHSNCCARPSSQQFGSVHPTNTCAWHIVWI